MPTLWRRRAATLHRACAVALLLCSASPCAGRPVLLRAIQRRVLETVSIPALTSTAAGVLGVEFERRPSAGRGQGLFALRDFDDGEFVCLYTGILRSEKEFKEAIDAGETDGNYVFVLQESEWLTGDGTRMLIDGYDPDRSSAARYINHSIRRQNCAFVQMYEDVSILGLHLELDYFAVHVRTVKRIRRGDELFLDYGEDYWDPIAPRPRALNPQRFAIDFL